MQPMSQTKTAAPERKATNVRQSEIVDAAIRIIAREGPRNFTAKRVATEVGITPGAVFRHFDTMADIVDKASERIGKILAGDFPTGIENPLERLHCFFVNRTKTIAAHQHMSRLLLSDHLAQAAGSKSGDRLRVFKRRSRDFVVECLTDAARSGILAPGVKPEAGAIVVLGAVLALSHTGTRSVRVGDVEQLSEDVWEVLRGLVKTSPDGKRKRSRKRNHV